MTETIKMIDFHVIEEDFFAMTIGIPSLPKEWHNLPEKQRRIKVVDAIKEQYGGKYFYNDAPISCHHHANMNAYYLRQEIRYKFECSHVDKDKVKGPYCPVCKKPNVMAVLPSHSKVKEVKS